MTTSSTALTRIILGIDPGTAITGYGVVGETARGDFELLACGVIRTEAGEEMHLRLLEIFRDLKALIAEFRPDAMAVEKLFFGRNVTTAITVGQARGAALLAAAEQGLDIAEYTPAEVKQAITGYGNADKRQIQEMVKQILHLPHPPHPDDAADGVAIAVCHLQRSRYQLLA
ncbi:MAG TPA: crossover junction endodeoxyribonuclease RuvC [Caldilineaceae bacterium]|nr:crossover junction endodeoxyribonuclease RuvC [Caldilineaceae bacterium]HRW05134.1 crossover junction endodeoxyribonuclease RuvC [Caldilineaceae bacterium]